MREDPLRAGVAERDAGADDSVGLHRLMIPVTTPADSEPGRGLQIVASLSVHWGWHPEPHGKAIYAILATKTDV